MRKTERDREREKKILNETVFLNFFTVFPYRWGEAYTWTNVNCCVHNIIVGKLWIEQYGTMEVLNHSTGHRAVLTFKPAGWFSKDLHRVEGFIMDKT